MEGTLIVAILALLVALGGLGLGIVNYFHTRKVDEKASEISYEQRKGEAGNILLEAKIACSNARGQYDLAATQSDIADMDFKQVLNQLNSRVEKTMQVIDQARDRLSIPMTRLELEEFHGRALELITAAKQVEASATDASEYLKNLSFRRPGA